MILWEGPNTGGWSVGLLKGRGEEEGKWRGRRGRWVHPSSLPTCTVFPPYSLLESEPGRLASEPADPCGLPLGSPCWASLSSKARFSWIRVLISSWNLHICSCSSLMRFTTHCEANERRRPKVKRSAGRGQRVRREEKEEGTGWVLGRCEEEALLSANQVTVSAFTESFADRKDNRLKPSVSDGSTMEASISASAGILNPLMRRSDRLVGGVLRSLCL